jgi:hypothetical protein
MYPLHQNFSLVLQQRLTSIEALSSIVNSFSRDTDQGSEAIAVLLDLTEYGTLPARNNRMHFARKEI